MGLKVLDVKVNYSQIRKKLENHPLMTKQLQKVALAKANSVFIPRKKELLERFVTHPVTMEIQAGERATNLSGVLSGHGNLFSFIGFEKGSNPAEELYRLLEGKTELRYLGYRNLNWRFRVSIPDRAAIIRASEIPWQQGASWALEIEKGISGLGFYMAKDSTRSRSGGGIQTKRPIRPVTAVRTPYLGDMLDDFRSKVIKR